MGTDLHVLQNDPTKGPRLLSICKRQSNVAHGVMGSEIETQSSVRVAG